MAKKQTNELEVDVTESVSEGAKKAPSDTVVNQTIVQTINPALAKQKADNDRIKKLDRDFKSKLAKEKKIKFKPPVYYAQYLSKVYATTLNGVNVVVRFDGTEQEFPETIYNYLMTKLARILESHVPEEKIDEL